jgi:hypothetical protein
MVAGSLLIIALTNGERHRFLMRMSLLARLIGTDARVTRLSKPDMVAACRVNLAHVSACVEWLVFIHDEGSVDFDRLGRLLCKPIL